MVVFISGSVNSGKSTTSKLVAEKLGAKWVKTDNIVSNKLVVTPAKEYLSKTGVQKARTVEPGALLITCIAGSTSSIGRCAITDRKISFNQQINAIQPNDNTDSMYLYWLIRVSKAYLLSHASTGMKKIITKGSLQRIELPMPPLKSQNEFSEIALKIEQTKQHMLHQSDELDNLFETLLGRSFSK
jgi:type I restriction enzyme S subunit